MSSLTRSLLQLWPELIRSLLVSYIPSSSALNNILSCRQQVSLVALCWPWLLCMVVARLVVMATIPLLAVMVIDVAMAMVPLMVASTTNPGNYLNLAVALCHNHSASCASKLGTLLRPVGTAMKTNPRLRSAMPPLLHPVALTITGDLDKLTMHDTYLSNDQIHATNGSGMDITRIGNSIIPTSSHNLVLNNVLHVPSTHKNLISVHRFTLDNDIFIEFHPYFFLIKDRKMRKVLLHDPCKGVLYPSPPRCLDFRSLCLVPLSCLSIDAIVF
jgi:hypothetical protein